MDIDTKAYKIGSRIPFIATLMFKKIILVNEKKDKIQYKLSYQLTY